MSGVESAVFEFDAILSHSSKDKPTVRAIAEKLKAKGVKIWLDEWQIQPGDSIPAKIEEGLEKSRKLVLFMSAHSTGSDWAQMEAGTFRFRDPLNKNRRFIPVRLDDAAIQGSLAQFLYIDWRNDPDAFEKLANACRAQSEWPFPQNMESQQAVDHLATVLTTHKNEWKRARADFEAEARKYHDASLALFYIETDKTPPGRFPQPNHVINLWQYFGENDKEGKGRALLKSATRTEFGLTGGQINAFGLITGKQYDLFCRMANRVGALIPNGVNETLRESIVERFSNVVGAKYPIFCTNSNPLARWINLILVAVSMTHPERFRAGAYKDDAFAASLIAFDYFKLGE